MSTVDIVGWAATIITVVYTMFGIPVQIKSNYQRKSTEGLSLFLFSFLFLTFLSWVIYGVLKSDYFIVVPNGLGAFFAAIILIQIFQYKDNTKNTSEKN